MFKTILSIISLLSIIAVMMMGLVYWVMNPELSQMEVFINLIWWFVGAIALSILLAYLNHKSDA